MSLPPHDEGLHPPGFKPIATVNGGTVTTCNGTAYWLDDDGSRVALNKLPKGRLVALILDEARTVAYLREALAPTLFDWLEQQEAIKGNGKAA